MSRTAQKTVHALNEETGETTIFKPGDEIPEGYNVTNPKVFTEEQTEVASAYEDDYEDWNKEQLQEELSNRELPVSGSKAELIQRLREDDEGAE